MQGKLNILHLEGDRLDADLIRDTLSSQGIVANIVSVGTEAELRAALRNGHLDLVLSDYFLPGFDGMAALRIVRELQSDLPFIFVSGTIGEDVAIESIKSGATDYVLKQGLQRLGLAVQRALKEVTELAEGRRKDVVLNETNQKLQTLIHASPLAIVALDLDRKVTLWNPAAERFFGWTELEVTGQFLPTIPQEDLPNQLVLRDEVLRSEGLTAISNLESRRSRKDGSIIEVSASFAPLRDVAGEVVGTIGIMADITERKRVEEGQLNSELRYRRLFESAKDGILILDAESGQIVDVNPYLCELLGFSKESLVRQHLWELGPFRDIVASRAAFAGLQRRGYTRYDNLPLEDRDGIIRQVEFVSNTYQAGENRVIQCNIRDNTERNLAEEDLRVTNHRLEKALTDLQSKTHELATMTQQLWQASKLATMGELAASVAHELNNPLATLALHAEALLDRLPQGDPKHRAVQVMEKEVERMASLVSNLLLFSRRSHAQTSTVDLVEELNNSLEFINYHLRSNKINVVTNFAPGLPSAHADRQQLRQLFLNVLTNCSDAMPNGGTLTVRAWAHQFMSGAPAIVIEFADDGIGIQPEDLPKLWEPFFTTKPEGRGTGLGLSICRRTVEEHHGTIDIASQPGKGTTVRIALPANEIGGDV